MNDNVVAPGGEGSSSGENACPECGGDGKRDGVPCAACAGTGIVVEPFGDA